MSIDTCWNEYEDFFTGVPIAVMLVAHGTSGEKLYFMHPFRLPERVVVTNQKERMLSKKEKNIPILQTYTPLQVDSVGKLQTEFNLTTSMLAEMLCVKDNSCNQPFEMKVDNIRFAGFPKKLSVLKDKETLSMTFSIVFVLPANVDYHIVESFQKLSSKLALAICEMQTITNYFEMQESIMRKELDHWDEQLPEDRKEHPYNECFVDDYIEVGICVQPKALIHNHLAPKNHSEVMEIIKNMRPYHGVLLLEDIWPTPDGNPHVHELLSYCSPELSLTELQYLSGIPMLKIFQIVEHLLLWARCIVIYPLAAQNVYTSATRPKPLSKLIKRFSRQFTSHVHLAAALAHFNPPAKLETFVQKNKLLFEQHAPARVVVFLLRHQLIMQLHKFIYIISPLSETELPSSPKSEKEYSERSKLLKDTQKLIFDSKSPPHSESHFEQLDEEIREIILNTTAQIRRESDYATARAIFSIFLQMIPFLHGKHHVEDIMYRLHQSRQQIELVIDSYSLVLSMFLRPDHIAD